MAPPPSGVPPVNPEPAARDFDSGVAGVMIERFGRETDVEVSFGEIEAN